MKKIILFLFVAGFGTLGFAQTENLSGGSTSDTTILNKITVLEQRVNRQENEIKALKKENATIKKEAKAARQARRASTSRVIIQRQGSKQAIVQ